MQKYYPVLIIAFVIIAFSSCTKEDVKPKETVVYQTDFSSNDGKWRIYEGQGYGYFYYQGDFYVVASTSTSLYCVQSEFFGGTKQNMAIEASVVIAKGPTHPGGNTIVTGGLIFGYEYADDNNYQYNIMSISEKGSLSLAYFDKRTEQWTRYIDDKDIKNIIHTDIPNKLRVELRNGMLYFYVNGTEVHKMTDVTSGSLEKPGFWVNGHTILLTNYFKVVTF